MDPGTDALRSSPRATVIVPAYNEEAGLAALLPGLMDLAGRENLDVLVVDDGSTDGTAAAAERAGARVLRHGRNRGYGAAIKTAARAAATEFLLVLDADGQHPVQEVPRLLEGLATADMVVAARPDWGGGLRGLGKAALTVLSEFLVDQEIPDLNSGFRAVRRSRLLEFLPILPNGYSLSTTITLAMLSAGYEVSFVDVPAAPRGSGSSQVRLLRDGPAALLLAVRVVTLFNPLKVFAPAAAVLLALGSAYLAWDVVRHFNVPSGAVLLILAGIQLFFFGVLADQVSAIRRGR